MRLSLPSRTTDTNATNNDLASKLQWRLPNSRRRAASEMTKCAAPASSADSPDATESLSTTATEESSSTSIAQKTHTSPGHPQHTIKADCGKSQIGDGTWYSTGLVRARQASTRRDTTLTSSRLLRRTLVEQWIRIQTTSQLFRVPSSVVRCTLSSRVLYCDLPLILVWLAGSTATQTPILVCLSVPIPF